MTPPTEAKAAHDRPCAVFVLIDGVGDVAVPSLQHETPLQRARTPTLDLLARRGVNGLVDPVEPGLSCGSDTAHLSLLGYNPRTCYRGRGAFESMGAGLDMCVGDIAFKSNFATLDPATNVVVSRRADRNFEGMGPVLCEALDGVKLPSFPNHTVAVKYATEHRCGVRVRGPQLSDSITGTDPLKDNLPLVNCEPVSNRGSAVEECGDAVMTSALVKELSTVFHEALVGHPVNVQRVKDGKNPANCVLLRGCGCRIDVPTFEDKHGLRSFMIAPTKIIAGLGMSISMDVVEAAGATGDYHTNLLSKGHTAVDTLALCGADGQPRYDFAFVHVKAVDDAGHDRNLDLKIKFIEEADRMVEVIMQRLPQVRSRAAVVVTGDHSTPVESGDHRYEPVPFLVSELAGEVQDEAARSCGGTPPDCVTEFNEVQASQGALGRFCGSEVMSIVKSALGGA